MRSSLALISFSIVLSVACGNDAGPGSNSSGGGAGAAQGGSPGAGASSAGTSSGAASGGSGGTPSGAGTSSGGAATAGSATTAGQGGVVGGGAGTSATAGSGGSGGGGGGGSAGGCTRELLKSTIDAYFKALAAHVPSTLPLADNVKFTENGKASKLGDEGLWKTAGALKYSHSALDTELCMSASEAVVPDGATDVPIALRLKLQDQKLTEVEMIVARAGDYPAVTANPGALAASNDVVKWETAPTDQLAKREELTGWMEKYFKQFPAGVCNTTSDCKRMENGGGSFVCGQGASCAAGPGSGQPVLEPRLVMADVQTGIGVGFTIFTGGYIDMHMFKMHGGKVHAVSAILANGTDSGWD
jgi:hypothetical protein